MLRLDPGLHAVLREAARRSGVSLNDYCARKQASPADNVPAPAADVVKRAASLFGEGLVAVVAFGSWTRGEQSEGS